MWQSRVENVHYSTSVKNELTVSFLSWASPTLCASVSAIRYLYEQLCPWKSFDPRALHRIRTQYSRHTVKFG